MKPRDRIIILLIINIVAFVFLGYPKILITCSITLYCLLYIFGILKTIRIFQNHFKPGICYLKDYPISESNNNEIFNKLLEIKKAKHLGDFSIIAFYYNKQGDFKQKEEKCSLGLYQKINMNTSKELDEDFAKEGFIKHELVDAKSINCNWDYFNDFTLNIGKNKFYSLMDKKFKSKKFMNAFKIDKNKIKVAIEIYDAFENKNINFYIPFENVDNFLLYQKTQ